MDVYRKGGDSMMGRYFPYRIHPLSVAELLDTSLPGEGLIRGARELDGESWRALWAFGGFPEPFIKRNRQFWRRWSVMRREQILREDVRDLSKVDQIDRLSAMVELLSHRSGEQVVYVSLGNEVKVDEKTVKSWIGLLKRGNFKTSCGQQFTGRGRSPGAPFSRVRGARWSHTSSDR